jgi:predicted RNA polymerase sigma factor
VRTAVADAFREEWGRINAALIHQTGDWDLAEECAQDAFAQAVALAGTSPERRFLNARLAEVRSA